MGWKTIGFDCLASLLTILSHASFFFFLISILSHASCGYELLNAICADKDSIIFLIVSKVWENHMILYFFKWCKKRAISWGLEV